MAKAASESLRKGVYMSVKASMSARLSPIKVLLVVVKEAEELVRAKMPMNSTQTASKIITMTENIL